MQIVKDIDDVTMVARNIRHLNSVGAIIDDNLIIHDLGKSLIGLESINKLEIRKSTSIFFNLVTFIGTFPFVYLLFALKLTLLEKLLCVFFIVSLLGLAIFIKKRKYIMLIKKLNTECIEFEIDKSNKEDAKKMVRVVNKMVKQLKTKKQ